MWVIVITVVVLDRFGPRVVFVYCFLHRVFFSMSKYIGLPRDESNLANATMFISTLKVSSRLCRKEGLNQPSMQLQLWGSHPQNFSLA